MTYVFDLDDTLCWTRDANYAYALPIWERIERLNALYDEGHRIIIDTARGSVAGKDWHALTERQLQQWGVKYHELRCGVKIPADHYIDDRATNVRDWGD